MNGKIDTLDDVIDIRTGEEVDIVSLDTFLKESITGLKGQLKIKQYPSGASNLTYQITYGNWQMVLRRPPIGHTDKSSHDMGRERKVMKGLSGAYPCVPSVLAYDDSGDVIGSPFYIMDKLEGIILRKDFPRTRELSITETTALCENFVSKLVELHKVNYDTAGLGDLGLAEGYIHRQIEGGYQRFKKAKTDDAPKLYKIYEWLRENEPRTQHACLIHNDFRLDNVVLNPNDPTKITGVLDWEMCTIGDPLMDLGIVLSYWVEEKDPQGFQLMRMQPSHKPGMLTRQGFIDLYTKLSGTPTDDIHYYQVYGFYRLSIALQQMYFRFKNGQTRDARFGFLLPVIEMYVSECDRLIKQYRKK